MRAALDYLLRKAGIVRRTALAPVKPQTQMPASGPAFVASEPAPPTGDANGDTGKDEEPAMAGIPEDAVQMPTPAAPSPGLPPVDPVEERKPSVARTRGAKVKAPSSRRRKGGQSDLVGRRAPPAGLRNWQDARYRVED
ncbi:MAG: hypothetical protein PGN25_04190 [Methylorubrum populi]